MNSDNNAVVVVEAEPYVPLGTIRASNPSDVILRASDIATELKRVIVEKHLFQTIKGKDFVRVEGWSTLGAMLGILPRERYIKPITENDIVVGYEAYIELLRASDGAIIGGASSICTRSETTWKSRDEYAIRSMAATRATGKAFRQGLSWIMTLAGYEVTPAEEMPDEPVSEMASPPREFVQTVGLQVTPQWVVENGYARTAKEGKGQIAEASNLINNLLLVGKPVEVARVKLEKYWKFRDQGLEPKAAAEKVIGEK